MAVSLTTSVEPLEGNKVRLHVAVPAAEFEKAVDSAFRKLAHEVKIPGFRPGKAPRQLLEARLGTGVARDQALRDALPSYYADAVASEELDTIAPPEIDITAGEDAGDIQFDAVVELRPVVTIDDYAGLTVTVPDAAVADAAVDAQLDALRERFADLEDSSTPLVSGDYTQIDIKGYVHDDAIDGLTATDFLYEIGSELIVPELDAELLGKRPGDILKFVATLPARFEDRAGQEVAFQVLVKETKRRVLPEVTDEWVSEVSEHDTLGALRADIRQRLELVARMQAQIAVRDRALETVAALVTVDVPEPLVMQEMERRLHDLAHRLEAQGATIPQYLAATGQEQEQFVAGVREGAAAAVRADLALRAVVAQEQIEATDDEVTAEIERLAERLEEKPEKVRRDLDRRGVLEAVRSDIARGKALQYLVDHAVVVDEAGNALDLSVPSSAEPADSGEAQHEQSEQEPEA
jgi:trigger factor